MQTLRPYLRESSSFALAGTDTSTAHHELPEPDPFTPEEFAAWRGMLRVHSAVFRELDRQLLAEHGLGIDAYGVMITLVTAPARQLPIGELGLRRNLSPSGISRSVDRLARLGLVERSANPDDRRSLLVGLTQTRRATPARSASHPPPDRPRDAARAARRTGPRAARRALGKGHARRSLEPGVATLIGRPGRLERNVLAPLLAHPERQRTGARKAITVRFERTRRWRWPVPGPARHEPSRARGRPCGSGAARPWPRASGPVARLLPLFGLGLPASGPCVVGGGGERSGSAFGAGRVQTAVAEDERGRGVGGVGPVACRPFDVHARAPGGVDQRLLAGIRRQADEQVQPRGDAGGMASGSRASSAATSRVAAAPGRAAARAAGGGRSRRVDEARERELAERLGAMSSSSFSRIRRRQGAGAASQPSLSAGLSILLALEPR